MENSVFASVLLRKVREKLSANEDGKHLFHANIDSIRALCEHSGGLVSRLCTEADLTDARNSMMKLFGQIHPLLAMVVVRDAFFEALAGILRSVGTELTRFKVELTLRTPISLR